MIENSFYLSPDFVLAVIFLTKGDSADVNQISLNNILKRFNFSFNDIDYSEQLAIAKRIDLSDNELKLIKRFLDLYNINKICEFKYGEMIHKFTSDNQEVKHINLCFYVDMLYHNNDKTPTNYFESSIKFIFRNNNNFSFYEKDKELINSLNEINSDYDNDLLEDFITDNNLIELLQLSEIESFKDLKVVGDYFVSSILCRNIDEMINLFKSFKDRKKDNVIELLSLVEEIEGSLSPKHKKILFERYGIDTERRTLEEISVELDLTKERVRQIESKVVGIIRRYLKEYSDCIRKTIISQKIETDFLTMDEIEAFIGDKKIAGLIRVFTTILCNYISYDGDLDILYYTDKLETIINRLAIFIPDYVKEEDLCLYSKLEYNIITKTKAFKNIKGKGYLRSSLTRNDLYRAVINDNFPQGFRINEEFCSVVNQNMEELYNMNPMELRALFGLIDRCDYCLIDRGTYIDRSFVSPLSDELSDEIIEYLSRIDGGAVYYNTIFNDFERKLRDEGITNRFYLKGVLDKKLSAPFITQRDYISVGNTFRTISDTISQAISSIEGVFDLDVLRKMFPGVNDFILINQCVQNRDILRYANGNVFISCKNKISNELRNELLSVVKTEIEYLMSFLNSKIVTSSKIYARMRNYHSELIDRIPFLDNHMVFFSYLSKELNGFYFRRPYLSNDASLDLNRDTVMNNYVDTLDYFNNKKIDSFCTKMHARYLSSYLDFMIEKSDKFIQVDETNCIKKELIIIDSYKLDKIKHEIDYFLNSFGCLDTSKHQNYDSYPNIGYKWNKYLLVGIIRCYFSDLFDIEYTDTMYTKTDFIIRRNKNAR